MFERRWIAFYLISKALPAEAAVVWCIGRWGVRGHMQCIALHIGGLSHTSPQEAITLSGDGTNCETLSLYNGLIPEEFSIHSIYPNPFREETTIDFGKVVDNAELKLFDILGKLVGEYKVNEASHFVLNREDKEKGVYFIDVKIENHKSKIFKLITE